MRALVYDGPNQMHIEERDRPEPGPGEVLLRLGFIGICGSDLHGYTGESGRRVAGMVMGHEASGWIEAVGAGVDGLDVGEPVTFNPALPCDGHCGHRVENQCAELRVIGVTPEIQGAFADFMVVDSARVVRLDGLDPETAAMAEPVAVAIQSVERCGIGPGEEVLVVGGGMIGLCIALAARHAGAGSVVITESMEERRELATKLGFEALEPSAAELSGFDVAVDAVGISATAAAAIGAVRRGGRVGFVGLGLPEVNIPLFEVVVPEVTIVGSFCYPDEVFERAVRLLRDGELDVSLLLGGVERFEDAHSAFEALAVGDRKDAKILISTGH